MRMLPKRIDKIHLYWDESRDKSVAEDRRTDDGHDPVKLRFGGPSVPEEADWDDSRPR